VSAPIDYSDILRAFVQSGIRFCLVGGFAAIAHGVVRVTMDLDLAISTAPENLEKSWDVLAKLGFSPRQPLTKKLFADLAWLRAATEEKGAKAISFFHDRQSYLIVDLLFSEEFQIEPRDQALLELFEVQCPVVTVEKLIELKTLASRPKDLEDIRELKRLQAKP
jgi:hypothetical protein